MDDEKAKRVVEIVQEIKDLETLQNLKENKTIQAFFNVWFEGNIHPLRIPLSKKYTERFQNLANEILAELKAELDSL